MPGTPAQETLAVHAGLRIDAASGAVAPSPVLSTTFERGADGGYRQGYDYARAGNPNRRALEECLAALEGGTAAAAFASGSAASHAVFATLAAGRHVVATRQMYHGTLRQLRELGPALGLSVSLVDTTQPRQVAAAISDATALIWVESPSNPLLEVADLAALGEIAHGAGAALACDSTLATPIGQQPLAHGADFVMHSTTKFIGGHSDVVGGIVVAAADDERFAAIRRFQSLAGATPSPFDAWLLRRSIATLPWRMRAHTDHAGRIAGFLAAHEAVERVCYPGLGADAELVRRQMHLPGGVLSFCLRGDAAAARAVANRARLFTQATSLGGVESLIEHRASIEGPKSLTPQNLLRLSIGLESADDLIADLAQMLAPLLSSARA